MSSPPKDRPRLTDEEKKANHIASEQKRRGAIRDGFDRLASMVPGMDGMGRSESVVLQGTIDEIAKRIEAYHDVLAKLLARGVDTTPFEIPDMDTPESLALLAQRRALRENAGASNEGNGNGAASNGGTSS